MPDIRAQLCIALEAAVESLDFGITFLYLEDLFLLLQVLIELMSSAFFFLKLKIIN